LQRRLLHGISGLDGDVRLIRFSPDERLLAASAHGEKVRLEHAGRWHRSAHFYCRS
jgi:hypothetical protein